MVISQKTTKMLGDLAKVVGVFLTVCGAIWAAATAVDTNKHSVEAIRNDLSVVQAKVAAHDGDIKEIRKTTTETATDVKWLREWAGKK